MARPLCALARPGTTRGNNIRPHLPLLSTNGSLQVLQESMTPFSQPLRHSSLCAQKIGTHFSHILLAIPVSLREFFSERLTASTQRLDLSRQSSHILQYSAHRGPPLIFLVS